MMKTWMVQENKVQELVDCHRSVYYLFFRSSEINFDPVESVTTSRIIEISLSVENVRSLIDSKACKMVSSFDFCFHSTSNCRHRVMNYLLVWLDGYELSKNEKLALFLGLVERVDERFAVKKSSFNEKSLPISAMLGLEIDFILGLDIFPCLSYICSYLSARLS